MKLRLLSVLFFATTLIVFPQIQIIDDFEAGFGRFNLHTTYSGSTKGILSYQPIIDSTLPAANGTKSLQILLIDNPTDTTNWFVRFLSGTGSPVNNLVLNDTGWVGYWLKCNRPYVSCGFILDDLNASGTGVGTNELSVLHPVIGDNQWHLYQWAMEDTNNWSPFIASGNGMIQDPVTIDAVVFSAEINMAKERIINKRAEEIRLDFDEFLNALKKKGILDEPVAETENIVPAPTNKKTESLATIFGDFPPISPPKQTIAEPVSTYVPIKPLVSRNIQH